MKTSSFLITAILAFFAANLPAAVILSDDFSGSDISAAWTYGETIGTASYTVADGSLTLDNATNLTSHRNAIATSPATGANPFAAPVTITLSGISLTSGSSEGTSLGYVVFGRRTADTGGASTAPQNYTALSHSSQYGGTENPGGALSLTLLLNNSTGVYSLQITDLGGTNTTAGSWALSGAPTDIQWTLDGTNPFSNSFSFELTGATIVSGPNGTGTNSGTGLWDKIARFTESSLTVGDTVASYIAIGTQNSGGLSEGSSTSFSLGGIEVTQIPEPATSILLASMLIGGCALLRRRA